MDKRSVLNLYDETYASSYDDQFLTNPFSKVSSDFEIDILKGLITQDTSWLDVGCGTGFFLSQFPGHNRAGLDISPAMLAQARRANPDVAFREGDFRIDIPEWHDAWSLISCMWSPYSYVESVGEFETMLQNLVKWTKLGGELFIPVLDLEDLRPEVNSVPYESSAAVVGGSICITSYTWTWVQGDRNLTHVNMVAPHVEHVVRLMLPFFETVEIVRYPPVYEGWVSRKAVLGRNKHGADGTVANVIRHPIPAPAHIQTTGHPQNLSTTIPNRQLLGELFHRIKNGVLFKAVFKKLFR